ncbi:MAG: carboxypeptidase-like regulatory domain-containing protein [Saprospiraceae bacterium]
MKQTLLTLALVVFAMGFALAQRTISGKVSDANGDPLIGASILVKGTDIGTVTDETGAYSLAVPEGRNVLVFSYTGFSTQEITLGTSNVVDLSLAESAEQLSEVLVTAIGIQREKKALGYAVTDLSGDQIAQRSEADPVRAVAGKVPGVQISGAGVLRDNLPKSTFAVFLPLRVIPSPFSWWMGYLLIIP